MRTLIMCIAFMLLLALNAYSQELNEMRSTINSAMKSFGNGDYAEALSDYEDIFESGIFANGKNKNLYYKLNYYAGYCAKELNDYERASIYIKNALEMAKTLKIHAQIPVLNTFLGEISKAANDYRGAVKYYDIARGYVDSKSKDAVSLLYLTAEAYRADKSYSDALNYCDRAINIAVKQKYINVEVACLTVKGNVYYETKEYSRAISAFTAAMPLSQNDKMTLDLANINLGLAKVHQAIDKPELARQYYEESLKFYVLCANTTEIEYIVRQLTTIAPCSKPQAQRVVESFSKYIDNYEDAGFDYIALQMKYLLAYYYALAENFRKSTNYYESVISDAMSKNYLQLAYDSSIALADLLNNTVSTQAAIKVLLKAQAYHATQMPPQYLSAIHAKKAELFQQAGERELAEKSYLEAVETSLSVREQKIYLDAIKTVQAGKTN